MTQFFTIKEQEPSPEPVAQRDDAHSAAAAAASLVAEEMRKELEEEKNHEKKEKTTKVQLQRLFDGARLFNRGASIVDQPWFNAFVGFMVLLNAIHMGLEVDFDLGMYGAVSAHIFTATWTVEFLLKVWTLGPRTYFSSKMNILDFLLACLAVGDVWLLPALSSTESGLRNLTVLRLLRLIRLIRLVKILRAFRELWLLINGLVKALTVLVWVIILLLLLMYVGAIFLTSTIGGECDKPEYLEDFEECFMLYGTLLRSMLTLFQVVTDGYMEVARPVFEKKPWMIFFFVGFVYLTSFGLMNIVAGVIFEQVLDSAAENKQREAEERLAQQEREINLVKKVLIAGDVQDKGKISPEEWLAVCEMKPVQQIFADLGMSVSRKRLAQRLYEVIDADRTQNVNLDVMLERIFQLKQEGVLQNQDMTLLLMDVRHQGRRLDRMEEKLNKMFDLVTHHFGEGPSPQRQMPQGPNAGPMSQRNVLQQEPIEGTNHHTGPAALFTSITTRTETTEITMRKAQDEHLSNVSKVAETHHNSHEEPRIPHSGSSTKFPATAIPVSNRSNFTISPRLRSESSLEAFPIQLALQDASRDEPRLPKTFSNKVLHKEPELQTRERERDVASGSGSGPGSLGSR